MPKFKLEDLARTQKIQEFLQEISQQINDDHELDISIKNRLTAICHSITTFDDAVGYSQLLAYLLCERHALRQSKSSLAEQFERFLDAIQINISGKNCSLSHLLASKQIKEQIEKRHVQLQKDIKYSKHRLLINCFYPLLTEVYKTYGVANSLVDDVNNLINQVIAESNNILILKAIADLTFKRKVDEKLQRELEYCWRAVCENLLVSGDEKNTATRYFIQCKARKIEPLWAVEIHDKSANIIHEAKALENAHLNTREFLNSDEAYEEKWIKLVKLYNGNCALEAKNDPVTKKWLLANLNKLILNEFSAYPYCNYQNAIDIFENIPSECEAKLKFSNYLKKYYHSWELTTQIKFLHTLVHFNDQQAIVDPFVQKAVIRLANQGANSQELQTISKAHNKIIADCQAGKRGPLRRFISWISGENNLALEIKQPQISQIIADESIAKIVAKYNEENVDTLKEEIADHLSAIKKKIENDINTLFAGVDFKELWRSFSDNGKTFESSNLHEKMEFISKHQKLLESQLQGQGQQIEILLKDYDKVREKIIAQDAILANPTATDVFVKILSKLSQYYLGSAAVASKKVKLEPGDFGKAGMAINIGGAFLPIPLLSQAVRFAGAGMELYDYFCELSDARTIAEVAPTQSRAEDLAEMIAEAIVLQHMNDIKELDIHPDGTDCFARDVYTKTMVILRDKKVAIISLDQVKTADNILIALHEPMAPVKSSVRRLFEAIGTGFKILRYQAKSILKNSKKTTEKILVESPKVTAALVKATAKKSKHHANGMPLNYLGAVVEKLEDKFQGLAQENLQLREELKETREQLTETRAAVEKLSDEVKKELEHKLSTPKKIFKILNDSQKITSQIAKQHMSATRGMTPPSTRRVKVEVQEVAVENNNSPSPMTKTWLKFDKLRAHNAHNERLEENNCEKIEIPSEAKLEEKFDELKHATEKFENNPDFKRGLKKFIKLNEAYNEAKASNSQVYYEWNSPRKKNNKELLESWQLLGMLLVHLEQMLRFAKGHADQEKILLKNLYTEASAETRVSISPLKLLGQRYGIFAEGLLDQDNSDQDLLAITPILDKSEKGRLTEEDKNAVKKKLEL